MPCTDPVARVVRGTGNYHLTMYRWPQVSDPNMIIVEASTGERAVRVWLDQDGIAALIKALRDFQPESS